MGTCVRGDDVVRTVGKRKETVQDAACLKEGRGAGGAEEEGGREG